MNFGVEIEMLGMNGRMLSEATEAAGVGPTHNQGEVYGWHQGPTIRRTDVGTTGAGWKVETDGSLTGNYGGWNNRGGLELISPILKGIEAGMREVSRVCTQINRRGAQVDRSCGTHITIGLDQMSRFTRCSTRKQTKIMMRIAEIYNHFQPCWDNLSPNVRRSEEDPNCLGRVNPANPAASRYQFLNVTGFITRGTVEFRQPGFTTSAKKIGMWLRLSHAVVKAALNNNHPSFGADLDNIPRNDMKAFLDFLAVDEKTRTDSINRVIELHDKFNGYRVERAMSLRPYVEEQ